VTVCILVCELFWDEGFAKHFAPCLYVRISANDERPGGGQIIIIRNLLSLGPCSLTVITTTFEQTCVVDL